MASLGLLAACGPGGDAETDGNGSTGSPGSTGSASATTDAGVTTSDSNSSSVGSSSTSATSTSTSTSSEGSSEGSTGAGTTEGSTGAGTTEGSTGAGTTEGSTGAGTTEGSGSTGEEPEVFMCPPPPNLTQEYVCFAVPMGLADCAACDAACTEHHAHVATTGDPLCSYFDFSVQCGPDPMPEVPGECCYFVAHSDALVCAGRPFVVEGRARVAPASRRSDWLPVAGHGGFEAVRASFGDLSQETCATLAGLWAADAADEHASVASFARFALQLLAVGAPASLVEGAQRAMADEIAHARACYALASAYAGCPTGPGPLHMSHATDLSDELPALVTAAVHEGCVGETLAALVAQVAAEQAQEPAVRATLRQIAADEGRHAQLAWRFVQWALARSPGLQVVVRDAFDLALRTPVQVRPWPADADAAALRVHGRLTPAEQVALCHDALAEVLAPAADALLEPRERAA